MYAITAAACDVAILRSLSMPQAGGSMYGVVAADGGLVALAAAKGTQTLAPSDLLLLVNFVSAHDSFRTVSSQGTPFESLAKPSVQMLHGHQRRVLESAHSQTRVLVHGLPAKDLPRRAGETGCAS